jgi:hypothetical protein
MKKYSLILILCLGLLLSGCIPNTSEMIVGSGKVITETRSVGNFTGLDLRCFANVTLAQGPLAVSIEGEENLLPLIETSVSGSKLSIQTKTNSNIHATKPILVYITVPELSSIRLSGSGKVDMDGLTTTNINLEISGSGNIHIGNLQAEAVTATISGSGDMRLDGKTTQQTIQISGSGDFSSGQLYSRLASVTISGSGNATLWVFESLSANISGSGDVYFYGTPGLDQKVSGSGNVEKLGDQP